MDDVVGVVVLAVGDEDLLAVELEACRRPAAPRACARRRDRSRPAARSGSSCRSTCRRPSCGRNIAFSASEPQSSSASIAPCVSSGHRSNAMLAPCHISSTAVATSCGRPWPPYSGFLVRPFQPLSAKLPVRVLESGRRPDACRLPATARLRGRRRRSADRARRSRTSPLPRESRRRCRGVASSKPGSLPTWSRPASSCQHELHVGERRVIGSCFVER